MLKEEQYTFGMAIKSRLLVNAHNYNEINKATVSKCYGFVCSLKFISQRKDEKFSFSQHLIKKTLI